MPSPHASPAMRPSSPLSPGYKTQRFDSLQLPSPRTMHARAGVSQRRLPNGPMRLPSLPRFHPANYPSAQSSTQVTPDGTGHSPQAPLSPRSHQHMYSDAQRQLFMHQREMISAASRDSTSNSSSGKPIGPRLAPLGSPGPVTPLMLEGDESYLVAGARSAGKQAGSTDELVDSLIRDEVKRHWKTHSPSRNNDWSR